jgi:hypothetical protein
MGEAFGLRQERDRLGPVAVDRGDVEDRKCPGENAPGRTVLIAVAVVVSRRGRLFPQHDGRAVLAFADLGFERLPLAIGAPEAVVVAGDFGGDPQGEDVDAAIALAGNDVDGRAVEVPLWCQGILNSPATASMAATISAVMRV